MEKIEDTNLEKINLIIESFQKFNFMDVSSFDVNNFNDISGKITEFINIPQISSNKRLSLKLNFINILNESMNTTKPTHKNLGLNIEYLLYNKMIEIMRINDKPMIFITLLKNSLVGEPNYNILQKLQTQRGFQIFKFLNVLFSNADDMLEYVKIQQIALQLQLKFNDILVGILKCVFIDILYSLYLLTENSITRTRIYSNITNLKTFRVEFENIKDYKDYYNSLLDEIKDDINSTEPSVSK